MQPSDVVMEGLFETLDSKANFPCSMITNQVKLGDSKAKHEFGIRRRHCCLVIIARAWLFLYHQVRLLVGVLKAVGTGGLTVPDVKHILDAKTITATSPMAPACGIYLRHVKYDLPPETGSEGRTLNHYTIISCANGALVSGEAFHNKK